MNALLFFVPWLQGMLEDTKGKLESVNRRTENTMAKKMIYNIYKNVHRKQTIGQHEPQQKPGTNSGAPLVVLVDPVTHPIKSHEWENGWERLTTSGTYYLGSFYRKVSSLPTPVCQF